jgi:hypothetical protein
LAVAEAERKKREKRKRVSLRNKGKKGMLSSFFKLFINNTLEI